MSPALHEHLTEGSPEDVGSAEPSRLPRHVIVALALGTIASARCRYLADSPTAIGRSLDGFRAIHPNARRLVIMQSERILRTTLFANAAFSTGSGLTLIVDPLTVQKWLGVAGVDLSLVLQSIGAGLLLFAAELVAQASRRPIPTLRSWLASVADYGWVLGTAVLLIGWGSTFSLPGWTLLVGVAAIVATCGTLQLIGIRRALLHPNPAASEKTPYYYRLTFDTPADPDRLWAVIADIGAVHRYHPRLATSSIQQDVQPGVGAKRVCQAHTGEVWAETCTAFNPATRTLDLEFDTTDSAFPFPFVPMTGGWKVEPLHNGGSRVTIHFAFGLRHAWMAWILPPLLVLGRRPFPSTVRQMTATALSNKPTS